MNYRLLNNKRIKNVWFKKLFKFDYLMLISYFFEIMLISASINKKNFLYIDVKIMHFSIILKQKSYYLNDF